MKCRTDKILLSKYADKALGSKKTKELLEHLDDCAGCRAQLNEYRAMGRVLSSVPEIKESTGFDEKFYHKLDETLAASAKIDIFGIIVEKICEFKENFYMPHRLVLVRAGVSFAFMFGALFSGLYYAEQDMPSVSTTVGSVMVSRGEHSAWEKIDKNYVLHKGDRLKTGDDSEADIALLSKYSIRLKENTVIKIAKLSPKYRNGVARIALSDGQIMVDIEKGFKGSKFDVETMDSSIRALGTKFVVRGDSNDEKAWVGVLEGKVMAATNEEVGGDSVIILPGMRSEIKKGAGPASPLPMIEEEWRGISELYMLGKKTRVALLVSSGQERVMELLAPCPIFITDQEPRVLPGQLEEAVILINKALINDNRGMHLEGIHKLEELVRSDPGADYNVQLLFFIGSYYRYINMYVQAINTFKTIIEDNPNTPLASLAECAIGVIYRNDLRDRINSKIMFVKVLRDHPASPEALFIKNKFPQVVK